jgi:AraC family transcriptional regulator, transcriptional activator of pobA
MAYDLESLLVVIDRHLRTTPSLSLHILAQRLNVERHSIERSVRLARGLTFRQLRNDIMLEEARKMLAEYPYSTIKEIAFRLGYRSQSAFGRFIKEASGSSPTRVRLNKINGQRQRQSLSKV